jgi:hypothetical protein
MPGDHDNSDNDRKWKYESKFQCRSPCCLKDYESQTKSVENISIRVTLRR